MSGGRWSGPRRIAHRGGGTLAPENTLAAIRTGLRHGYRAVEFDVMLTADDVPILMHDADLGRTVTGSGSIASLSWTDLSRRDAGAWWSADFLGEPVPRYEDVVRFCAEHGVWMNVEIKPSPGAAERTGRIVGELTIALAREIESLSQRLVFSSFDVVALGEASRIASGFERGLLVERISSDTVTLARSLGCISINAAEATLNAAAVEQLHVAGFAVLAYTVADPARARALSDDGVDALFVDAIDRIPFD